MNMVLTLLQFCIERIAVGVFRGYESGPAIWLLKPELDVVRKLKVSGMSRKVDRVSWWSAPTWISILCIMAILGSAMGVIYTSHLTRKLYSELEVLQDERDAFQSEWSQLLLEQSAWSAHGRIEHIAIEEMGMRVPDQDETVIVQ